MTLPVVAAALVFWVCVFMVYFTSAGTTPREFFFGRYEAPPHDLGRWQEQGMDAETQLLREERYLLPGGRSSPHLVRQVRYRDPQSRKIVQIGAETRVPRPRVGRRP
ncbi:MAG: hypothetical protein ABUL60_12165 [Myxococcales bacterium]